MAVPETPMEPVRMVVVANTRNSIPTTEGAS
jgi:hypothetical protein